MRMIFRYMKVYARRIASSMTVKLLGAVTELMIPYILEHLIDEVVPLGQMRQVILWGLLMIATALITRQLNVWANRMAIDNAHNVSYDIRQDLFTKTANLSGAQFDAFGLPSLISRMTSDSYNVQSCVQTLQTLCVRVPMMLLGGIAVTMMMDAALSAILCVLVPVLIVVILGVSRYGIPLYRRVQERLDDVVRVMREDISGIRVVKALSKTEYEKRRFERSNEAMTRADIKASTIMAIPGPLMQMCLNIGLTLVVWLGAARVDSGQDQAGRYPGVSDVFQHGAAGRDGRQPHLHHGQQGQRVGQPHRAGVGYRAGPARSGPGGSAHSLRRRIHPLRACQFQLWPGNGAFTGRRRA